jgi:hypothetical protein
MSGYENAAKCPECGKGDGFGADGGLPVEKRKDGRVWITCADCGYEWTQHTVGIPGRTPPGRFTKGPLEAGPLALGT